MREAPPVRRPIRAALLAALAAAALLASSAVPAMAGNDVVGPTTRLYTDPASTTFAAAATLTGQARADAILLGSFPTATWITSGTPSEARAEAARVVNGAHAANAVATIVAYNVPFRDCSQYSAGGAKDTAEYNAWIDGLAAGIGNKKAIVLLEPDGLGIIPHYTNIDGSTDWCKPAEADPATAPAERFAQLNHGVDVLKALPNTAVYLDGTHNGWLNVGESTDRLLKAGVAKADGAFLNTSNYQPTSKVAKYGTWLSQCIDLVQNASFNPLGCASQYYPASPDDESTWALSDAAYDKAFADAGRTFDPATAKHFVIDTSRNGQGPWTPPAGKYSDAETWCNPPARGLGLRPTTQTGNPLADAYLWIKVPGESDGLCYRGTGGPLDPERGMVDPAAGQWFVEQAAELIALAVPAVTRPTCEVTYRSHAVRGNAVATEVRIKNTGTAPIRHWELQWSLTGTQRVTHAWGATIRQKAAVVTARNLHRDASIRPGAKVSFGFVAKTHGSASTSPHLFTLNGKACAVS